MWRRLVVGGGRWSRRRCDCNARRRVYSTAHTPQADEPLRILFCGADDFSITSLRALHQFSKSPDSNILSIDVAAKKDRRVGRGMKQIRSPLITSVATELELPLHRFDTFTGWNPPEYASTSQPDINLIIAVSFALLVPPRILKHARFGGLNLHPSLLPDLKGAAPIHWAIINGYKHTGVSIQTLHPSRFDEGVVLSQTPAPGIVIPRNCTTPELERTLAHMGAEMLVGAIRERKYLQPQISVAHEPSSVRVASKITPSAKMLDAVHDDMQMILRKNRAIPKLWSEAKQVTEEGEKEVRVIFGTDMRPAENSDVSDHILVKIKAGVEIGRPFVVSPIAEDIYQSSRPVLLFTSDGNLLALPTLLVAGNREGPAAAAAAHGKLLELSESIDGHNIYRFYEPLSVSQEA